MPGQNPGNGGQRMCRTAGSHVTGGIKYAGIVRTKLLAKSICAALNRCMRRQSCRCPF